MQLGLSGLASGFDWNALVDQLTEVERAPQRRLQTEQSVLSQHNQAYANLASQLTTLKTRADALKDPTLFDSRTVRVGDTSVASATADGATGLGTYSFHISQMATASVYKGGANAGQALNATDVGQSDLGGANDVALSSSGFATRVTAGTFTVNGKQVTVEATDTLAGVFDKIATATGGAVSATYSTSSDKITLSGSSPIVLGSANDSSNFLTVAKLTNNDNGPVDGIYSVASTYELGAVVQSATLANAKLAVAISDGGSGAGSFKVNGVSIEFNATTDTVSSVLARINNSSAGVTASYDATQDRFALTNKTTGDLGVALEDVTGNFLEATGFLDANGLSSGVLTRGNNLLYTINGGDPLSSQSNTITTASSGIPGLSLAVLKGGTTTVQVTPDTSKVKSAIADFIAEYNRVQTQLDGYTASSTSADGKVSAGLLAGQSDSYELASGLRGKVNAVISGLSGTLNQLAALGIASNGTDDTLSIDDGADLDTALANRMSEVQALFSDTAHGLGTAVSAYLETLVGDSGSLVTRQSTLRRQITDIDTQISDQERIVQNNREQMITSFLAMEQAQAKTNQQIQFLSQRFGTSTS